jgi:hypothetical protein
VSTLDESWERTEKLMLASFDRPDLAEGVASYVDGRHPQWPPLILD